MEVEVRAKVNDLQEMKKGLEAMGASFGKEKKQVDYIFRRKGDEKKEQKPGDFILRIRDSEKKTLALKALTDVMGAWEEYELGIDNAEEMRKIVERMGFFNSLIMVKKRIPGKLDDFSVCLDDVDGLGTYIEIELKSDDKKSAKKRLAELSSKLGIKEDNIEHKGYVVMLSEKQGIKYKGTG